METWRNYYKNSTLGMGQTIQVPTQQYNTLFNYKANQTLTPDKAASRSVIQGTAEIAVDPTANQAAVSICFANFLGFLSECSTPKQTGRMKEAKPLLVVC
tara:strand:- start:2473 stop:2772 length:300 start_codon:yes stop_codon:yes gene_type:complete